jgi:hypothetical protein|nr:MAG TPA: hypothetical protein [Caudoviricetes sp.]
MLKGKYTPGPVIDATLRVFVDGVERPHLSASWEGNTSGGLPDALVTIGDGIHSRTGSIAWAPESAVVDSPLAMAGDSRWMPTHGAQVRIVAEVGGVEFPRFYGTLGASTYSLTTDTVTTAITDGLQGGLQSEVSIPPMYETAAYGRTAWVAYRAIEQSGYGVLPPVTDDTVLQNSHQYGAAAAVGKMQTPGSEYGTPAGLASRHAQTTLATLGVTRGDRDLMIYARAGEAGENSSWSASLSDGSIVSMSWDSVSKRVVVWTSRAGHIVSIPVESPPDGAPLMCVKINAQGARVWKSTTESELYPRGGIPGTPELVSVTTSRTLGIKADYLRDWEDGARRVLLMGRPLPKLKVSALEQKRVPATRGFENVTCQSVVEAWCAATLSAVWVDEEGRLNMAARDRLAEGKSSITDRVSERVFGGSWKTERDGVRSAVTIKGLESNSRGAGSIPNIVANQPGNIQELQPNEKAEFFVTWPDNVDVHDLDTRMKPVVQAKKNIFAWDEFNKGFGSWWAISFENTEKPEGYRWTGGNANHEDLTAMLETLGQRTVKLTFMVAKKSSGGPEKYYLCTPSLAVGNLRYGNRAMPMPVLRCGTLVTWTDYKITARAKGEAGRRGGEFTLDSSWWLTSEDARRVARALVNEISVAKSSFDSIPMLWDPRKQIGDTVTLLAQDQAGTTWEADCLITGYRESWDGKVPTVSYDMDVKQLRNLRAGKTYGDMARAYATYRDIPSGKTYAEIHNRLPERA